LAAGLSEPDFSALNALVGHATDTAGGTGLTIVRGNEAFRGAVSVVGRATGTRELQALEPSSLADRVDAVMLTGGSAYGLNAAAGVMRWHEERKRGFPIGPGVVPIVPAAVIFDLGPCGRFDARPTAEMAIAACDDARATGIAEGSVGAGTGATVGKAAGIERAMKGGVGCFTLEMGGVSCGAVAVVNAFGDVRSAEGVIIAGAREGDSFMDSSQLIAKGLTAARRADATMQNTSIAVVVTSVPMSRLALNALARAATAALFRRITPTGTQYDGDIVFALCPRGGNEGVSAQAEQLAVLALEQAIERAVLLARGRDGIPGAADRGTPRDTGR
jgi:L-aminopeptidase/D-esterase-like protein